MSRNQSSSSSTSQPKGGKISHVVFCNVFLEELAKKLQHQLPEGIKPEISDEWKKKVVELAGQSTSISFHEEQCKKIVSELEKDAIKDFKSDKIEDRIEEVRAILKKRSQGFDLNTSDSFKKIKKMLIPSANRDDDDIEVFEDGTNRDGEFKCPITCTAFIEPMKK